MSPAPSGLLSRLLGRRTISRMTIADKSDGKTGHRERLREKVLAHGAGGFADYEILEYLLFGAMPQGDTKPAAKALIAAFGSLAAVLAATPEEIIAAKVPKVGRVAASMLAVTMESARRVAREHAAEGPVLSSWSKLIDYLRISMGHGKTEEFRLLFLDSKNRLIRDEQQSKGTVNQTAVYPREVVRRALELGSTAIIMVHNHPSGDPTPSRADIEITKSVRDAGKLLGVTLHDHVVITKAGHESFRSLGLI